MKLFIYFLISASLNTVFARGGDVGNAGGFSLCTDQKYYNYDYLITLKANTETDRLTLNLTQSLQFITSQLQRLQDPLAEELLEFTTLLYTQIPKKKFQWFQQVNLPMMYDPDLEASLPTNCKSRKQAVYYFAPFDGIYYASYKYDPQLISNVLSQENGSLQVSYLWIHEWLWNHFSSNKFKDLAAFNRLLHSESLSQMSANEYFKKRPALK